MNRRDRRHPREDLTPPAPIPYGDDWRWGPMRRDRRGRSFAWVLVVAIGAVLALTVLWGVVSWLGKALFG